MGGRIAGQLYWNMHRRFPPSFYRTLTTSRRSAWIAPPSSSLLRSNPFSPAASCARRTFYSGAGRSRTLESLERKIQSGSAFPSTWASYFKELNKLSYSKDVVQKFQRLDDSMKTSDVTKEYLKALVLTNKIDSANLESLSNGPSGGSSGTSKITLVADTPLPVIVSGGSGTSNWPKVGMVVSTMLLGIFAYVFYNAMKGGDSIMGINTGVKFAEKSNVTFADVLGADDAKAELEEIVQYLKDPGKYTKLGAKLPKGVLLVGPAGTGKTLLAKAIAGEAGVPFLYCSGSEFDEMFVGVGPRRVRKLFEEAKKKSPAIIFIDELDSVGSSRQKDYHRTYTQTINQLLTEMDGFVENVGVIVLAATNFPEALDPALTRPGRFDKRVDVLEPDIRGRKQILEYYLSKVVVESAINVDVLAKGTPGFTGADLANLVNIAATKAATKGLRGVTNACIDEAKDDIMMGIHRKSMLMTEEEKRLTAYHEGGHTLVAIYTEGAQPLHKATILPRGPALGVTHFLVPDNEHSRTQTQYLASIAVGMGGRAAEEIIFGPKMVTSGAASDMKMATQIAESMVLQFGMSEKVGPVFFPPAKFQKLSPETKSRAEREIEQILREQYARARSILLEHQDELHRLAHALMDRETLDKEEVLAVIKGQKLTPLFPQ